MMVTVMRQHHQRIIIAILAQPTNMNSQGLSLCFVVVQHPDFTSDELSNPDHGIVGLRTSAADVPECPNLHQWIDVYSGNATAPACCSDACGVVGSGVNILIVPSVDVIVLIWLVLKTIQAFLLKSVGPPGIVEI